ncbi:MAG: 50S ribosomal protein L21 [Bacteroidia bacterium]|nr:50S ribosomal protein L21 [Bacteroidia bacterium]MDW8347545.1 50S ribosomal protein L21 [Bacteroidia bacterium]
MYAIVDIAGQQFKVSKDQELFVHKLKEATPGAQIQLDKVLLIEDAGNVKIGTPVVEGAKVIATILEPLIKGDKVIVFKKKRRKGYKRKKGHRQQFSKILINDILH